MSGVRESTLAEEIRDLKDLGVEDHVIKRMMDIQLVTELKGSLHNYDGGLAIERRDSGRIKY